MDKRFLHFFFWHLSISLPFAQNAKLLKLYPNAVGRTFVSKMENEDYEQAKGNTVAGENRDRE